MDTPQRKQPGQKLTSIERLGAVSATQDLMDSGVSSIRAIARALNVSNDTAAEYKKQAMYLATKESPDRESIRMLQYNRISRQAEKVSGLIERAQRDYDNGKAVSIQSIAALHNVLRGYMELLHRIMGLNTEVNVNVGAQQKPLMVYMSRTVDDATLESDAG
jgi:hypothetical protein